VCCGLQYLHERGIYHRDIKPENILQTSDGQYMIGDFGISVVRRRQSTSSSTSTALSSSAGILLDDRPLGVGTPLFMAPELLVVERTAVAVDHDDIFHEDLTADDRAALPAADMWALGVTLLALALGRWPFENVAAFRHSPEVIISPVIAHFSQSIARIPSCNSVQCFAARCAWADSVSTLLSVDMSTRPSASSMRKMSKSMLRGDVLCEGCGAHLMDPRNHANTNNKRSTSEDTTTDSMSYLHDKLQVTLGPDAATKSMEFVANGDHNNARNALDMCSRGPSDLPITRAPVDDNGNRLMDGADDPLSRNERDNQLGGKPRRATVYDSWRSTRPQSGASVEGIFSTEDGDDEKCVGTDSIPLIGQRGERCGGNEASNWTVPSSSSPGQPRTAHPPATSPQGDQSPHRFRIGTASTTIASTVQ
jgi:serine/threonine protein kinase